MIIPYYRILGWYNRGMTLQRWFVLHLVFLWFCFFAVVPYASAADVLGIHILNIHELDRARDLLKTEKTKEQWDYVTIPFTLDDLNKLADWQRFFYQARDQKFQLIVRLTTKFENGSWRIPTRKEITRMATALSSLDWPITDERIIVVFNEPNHRGEWGGTLDPESYAHLLRFTADWFHTEKPHYVVLPAGLDLAAPSGPTTMEAFTYLERMVAAEPEIFDVLDGWTSHSYPNPAFSSAPTQTGKNSIRGFEHELAFLKRYTEKEFPVYITETGWVDTRTTSKWLSTYYAYAVDHVWSDPRVRAVTPFVLQGAPGTFAPFSFYDAEGKPTKQFDAYKKALEE
jgi:hypothetical protein